MICMNCNKEVDEKDNFIHIIEWDKGEKLKQHYLHKKCWEDKMDIKKKSNMLFKRAWDLIGKAEEKLV